MAQMVLRMDSHSFNKYLFSASYGLGPGVTERETDTMPALMEPTA